MFSLQKAMSQHKGRVFEKWVFDAHSPLLSSALIADIDDDGEPEVIFGTKEGSIFCLDKNAEPKWQYAMSGEISQEEAYFYDLEKLHAVSNEPVVADLNANSHKKVIFGADDGFVYVLNDAGGLEWKYEVGGMIKGRPQVVDIDNDGYPEIIVTSTAKKLCILSHDGKLIASYDTPAPSQATPGILRGKDGKQTVIVFGLDDGSLHAVNTQEEQLWTFKTGEKITAEPIFVDDMILIGSWDGSLYALNMQGECRWRFRTEGAIYNKVVIGDINNDKKKEIVFGSCDNSVYALTLDGEKLWSYETDFWVMAHPILHDIDNDGNVEVIVGSFDSKMYVLEGSGSYEMDYVPGISGIMHQAGHYADLLSSAPGDRQGKSIWQYKTKGMIVGCSLFDGDLVLNVKSGFVDALNHKK